MSLVAASVMAIALRVAVRETIGGRVAWWIFVLTTTDNPVELDRCYALGAAACLVKPVDYGAFGEMIHRLAEFLMTAALPGELPEIAHGG